MVVEETAKSNNSNSTDASQNSDKATPNWGYDLYVTSSYSELNRNTQVF